jgi:hypothetical protein
MVEHYMDEEKQAKWDRLLQQLTSQFQMEPDLKGILFLIGIRETGNGNKTFTKEQKEDFMNLAICRILSLSGYFSYQGVDEYGWPDWRQEKSFPRLELNEQEEMLKAHVVEYFEVESILDE